MTLFLFIFHHTTEKEKIMQEIVSVSNLKKTFRLSKKQQLIEKTKATVFIVAQRISTIRNADKIIVLDEGKIVGEGKHEDLLRDCEVYKQIAYSQLSKEELA